MNHTTEIDFCSYFDDQTFQCPELDYHQNNLPLASARAPSPPPARSSTETIIDWICNKSNVEWKEQTSIEDQRNREEGPYFARIRTLAMMLFHFDYIPVDRISKSERESNIHLLMELF